MKIAVVGKQRGEIIPFLEKRGFTLTQNKKELECVICYGGDGTLIYAENTYPGIPKVILRASTICKKCSPYSNEEIVTAVLNNTYIIERMNKITVQAEDTSLTALSDIIVHNQDPRTAIRYNITIDDTPIEHEIVGDGIVIATPFGSTGYYRSITGSYFYTGFGLAINNSTEQFDHIVLQSDGTVTITITRGPAGVFADNQDQWFELAEGNTAHITCSTDEARIVRPIIDN